LVWDHVIRSLGPRDERLFRLLSAGDDYPKAHALAERLFEREAAARRLVRGTAAYRALHSGYVPPYDHRKFPNKWRKIEPDAPARTLMAHLGKDGYSHIHYDSAQARVISVREAARLQSFPDGFRFEGTMNPAFRQIGNAVPPVLAWRLAASLLGQLGWKAIRSPWPEKGADCEPVGLGKGCADGARY
jgi:DNA (cytosine-5)-methyltransferase 1